MIGMNTEADGNFPNIWRIHPDPSVSANAKKLIEAVIREKADIGLKFDGDGDRAVFVDNKGRMVSGDIMILLLARKVLAAYPHTAIVYDIKCSQTLEGKIAEWGGIALRWKTGFSAIKEK